MKKSASRITRTSSLYRQQRRSLRVISIVRNCDSGTFCYRVKGRTVDGGQKSVLIPREDAVSRSGRVLSKFGFCDTKLPPVDEASLRVETAINQLGFQRDGGFASFFASAGGNRSAVDRYVLSDQVKAIKKQRLRKRGTLEDFRQQIAPFSRQSSLVCFATCCAFASPLLDLVGAPSFGVVFFGPSGCGKSTLQVLAGSVVGFGSQADLFSHHDTPNALMENAALFRGHAFIVNEAAAGGSKAEVYDRVFQAAYGLMSGADKRRHSSFERESSVRSNQKTSSIFLYSSEVSPDGWAERACKRRDDGEKSRMIGLPVARGSERSIFDGGVKVRSAKKERAASSKLFRRAYCTVKKVRGSAFVEFMNRLAADKSKAKASARKYVRRFEARAKDLSVDNVTSQIVANFALIFAGGALAVDYDIWPLKKGRVLKGIVELCARAVGELPNPRAELDHSLEVLRNEITRLADKKPSVAKLDKAPGYCERREGDSLDVTLRASAFQDWIPHHNARRDVLSSLYDKGYLRTTKQPRAGGIEWAETQPTWPNQLRPRSIRLRLPHGIQDLKSA